MNYLIKQHLWLLLLLLFFSYNCKTPITPQISIPESQANEIVNSQTPYNATLSTLTVEALGGGKNANVAIANAERIIYERLLFQGIPGTAQAYPLIKNEQDAPKESLNAFFTNQIYKRFTITTQGIMPFSKKDKQMKIAFQINHKALRKYLVQNSIIPKFGL